MAHIPLASDPAPAAEAVISIFALWGLSQLTMGIVHVVALLRCRSMFPLRLLLSFSRPAAAGR